MTSLMTLCNMTTVNMVNKFYDDQIDILINMWQSEPALSNSNLLILQQCQRMKGSIGTNHQPTEYRHW